MACPVMFSEILRGNKGQNLTTAAPPPAPPLYPYPPPAPAPVS